MNRVERIGALLAILCLSLAMCACDTPAARNDQDQKTQAAPEATPKVTAGDFANILNEIRQQVTQIQNSLSVISNQSNSIAKAQAENMNVTTNNTGLDRTWAKFMGIGAVVVLAIMSALAAAPAPPVKVRLALWIAAGALLAVAVVLIFAI